MHESSQQVICKYRYASAQLHHSKCAHDDAYEYFMSHITKMRTMTQVCTRVHTCVMNTCAIVCTFSVMMRMNYTCCFVAEQAVYDLRPIAAAALAGQPAICRVRTDHDFRMCAATKHDVFECIMQINRNRVVEIERA